MAAATLPGGQIAEKSLDLAFAHLARMAFAIGQDETFDPAHIRLLRTQAVMFEALATHLVQQAWRLRFPNYYALNFQPYNPLRPHIAGVARNVASANPSANSDKLGIET